MLVVYAVSVENATMWSELFVTFAMSAVVLPVVNLTPSPPSCFWSIHGATIPLVAPSVPSVKLSGFIIIVVVASTLKRSVKLMFRCSAQLPLSSAATFTHTSSEFRVTPFDCVSRTRLTNTVGYTCADVIRSFPTMLIHPFIRIDFIAILTPSLLLGPSPCAGDDRHPVLPVVGLISPPVAVVDCGTATEVLEVSKNLVSIPRRPPVRMFLSPRLLALPNRLLGMKRLRNLRRMMNPPVGFRRTLNRTRLRSGNLSVLSTSMLDVF